jgi:RNA polymerase sigma factor (sigma-70 family)
MDDGIQNRNPDDIRSRLFEILDAIIMAVAISYRDVIEPDDLRQNVAVAVCELSDDQLHRIQNKEAYIRSIARNKIINALPAHKKQAAIQQLKFAETLADPKPASCENGEDLIAKMLQLAKADDIDRQIIYLHYVDKRTFGEIAELLSMTETAVRKRHHRLIQKLRTILDPTDYGYDLPIITECQK